MAKHKLLTSTIILLICSSLAAQFNIKNFSDTEKYGWKDIQSQQMARKELQSRQKLLQIYEMEKQSKIGNIIKSAITPGWGQLNTQHCTKGQMLLGLELIIAGSSYYFYDRASEEYDLYLEANYIGDIKQHYEDASTFNFYSKGLMMFGIAIWAYNLYDTYQTTEEFNANVWNNILKQYHSEKIQVSLQPLGFEVRF